MSDAAMFEKVVGLDLSTTGTGVVTLWRCGTGDVLHDAETVTRATKKAVWDERELCRFADSIDKLVLSAHPKLVVLEGYGYASQRLAPLAELGGCVRKALHGRNIPFVVVAPATVKKFVTGKGKTASGKQGKMEVIAHIGKKWGAVFNDDNQADAYVLARMGLAIVSRDEWQTLDGTARDCFAKIAPSFRCHARFPRALSRVLSRR